MGRLADGDIRRQTDHWHLQKTLSDPSLIWILLLSVPMATCIQYHLNPHPLCGEIDFLITLHAKFQVTISLRTGIPSYPPLISPDYHRASKCSRNIYQMNDCVNSYRWGMNGWVDGWIDGWVGGRKEGKRDWGGQGREGGKKGRIRRCTKSCTVR